LGVGYGVRDMQVEGITIQLQNGGYLSVLVRKASGPMYYYPSYSLRAATILFSPPAVRAPSQQSHA
jgi:hypothetical protein